MLTKAESYPFLKNLIQEEMGSEVTIVDSALSCAAQVKTMLQQKQLEAPPQQEPNHCYFVSDDPEAFRLLAEKLLNQKITKSFKAVAQPTF